MPKYPILAQSLSITTQAKSYDIYTAMYGKASEDVEIVFFVNGDIQFTRTFNKGEKIGDVSLVKNLSGDIVCEWRCNKPISIITAMVRQININE